MQLVILSYFIFVNLLAFFVYWVDKVKSEKSSWRISELELHVFSLLGGFFGASLSMYLFRHKTSKSSFLVKHIVIVLVWIVALAYLLIKSFFEGKI